jgi:magnesium chelatase subunit D
MLLAVDPRLKGALIASGPGTSKSLLARSFETILPEKVEQSRCLLVEVPLNVSEDRLLGGLDLELTLATGRREPAAGLLARADNRVLYIDEINLLDTGLIAHLAAALDSGHVRLEREGISKSYRSNFVLVGTYDPAEGELCQVIRDRVGLHVYQPAESSGERREEIAGLALRHDLSPAGHAGLFEDETASIKREIEAARARLPKVAISRDDIGSLSRSALDLGVRGSRADIFAVRAALASAAFAGRPAVEEEDLLLAVKLVLVPRATKRPPLDSRAENESGVENGPEVESRVDDSELSSGPFEDVSEANNGFSDLVIKAIDTTFDLPALSSRSAARYAGGKRIKTKSHTAGRYVASTRRRVSGARVAIDATLRAAACNQEAGSNRVRVTPDDLRYKVLKRRAGVLVIFAVDASGSMAINRVAQAKGAMTRLLEKSYLHRDKVAFVSFRGEDAKVLLQPTRSVALGKRLIDSLPTGGPTPIAKGLLAALEIARNARLQDKTQSLLLIFTDGRANVGLWSAGLTDKFQREAVIQKELKSLGAALRKEGVHPVIIDTRSRYVSGGESRALAERLGGRYLYLPRGDADSISSAVRKIAYDSN